MRELLAAEEAARLRRQPHVQADHVRGGQDLVLGGRPRARGLRMRAVSPGALQPSTFMPMARRGWPRARRWCPCRRRRGSCRDLGEHLARPLALRASRGRAAGSAVPPPASGSRACSATAKALTPGVLQTVTPRMPAALRSMLSVPVPQTETILRSRQAAKTPSLKRAWARMLIATCARPMRRISSSSSSAPRSVNTRSLAQALRALVGRLPVEDARGSRRGRRSGWPRSVPSAKTAWAADTPAPGSAPVAEVAQGHLERGERGQHVHAGSR